MKKDINNKIRISENTKQMTILFTYDCPENIDINFSASLNVKNGKPFIKIECMIKYNNFIYCRKNLIKHDSFQINLNEIPISCHSIIFDIELYNEINENQYLDIMKNFSLKILNDSNKEPFLKFTFSDNLLYNAVSLSKVKVGVSSLELQKENNKWIIKPNLL